MHTRNTARVSGGNVCKLKRTRDIDIKKIIGNLKKKSESRLKKGKLALNA